MQRRQIAIAIGVLMLASSCGRTPPAERLVWSTGSPGSAVRGDYTPGDVTIAGGDTWICYVEGDPRGDAIRIRRQSVAAKSGEDRVLATLPGTGPGLLIRDDGTLVLVARQLDRSSNPAITLREGSKDGRTWSASQRISSRSGRYDLTAGRLVRNDRDSWFVPATWTADGSSSELICLHSADGGSKWNESVIARGADLTDPAMAALGNKLVVVVRQGTRLVRSESSDQGVNWSALEPIGVETDTVPHALESLRGGMALSWTDPPPDSSRAAPGLRAVRLSMSTDLGKTWHPMMPLAWRAGVVPECPALAFDEEGLTALIANRGAQTSTLSCVAWDVRQLEPAVPGRERPRGRYSIDPARAAAALELLCTQTLERPAPSQRLFIEGYHMRTLVLAHAVLGATANTSASARPRTLDTQEGLVRALSFTDWMIQGQDSLGYWPLGYKAVFVADMASVVGLLATLEPYTDAERLRHYEKSAARFVTALENDRMILPSGAYGIGWHDTRERSEDAVAREPYLISTSLAGIEVHAWLYSRTHDERYRKRALAALDYTLSQLQPDGSFADSYPGGILEGALMVAAYVEEGWMAADRYLPASDVHHRWRKALGPHIDWLLRRQSPDGTWGATEPNGEYARTPNIIDFLIWYDEKVEHREDIRRAVHRASVTFSDPDHWDEIGLSRAGKNEDVFRAIAGRALAAMAADRSVF